MIIHFDLKILVSCSMYTYYENEMIDTLNQVIVTLCHVSQEGDKKPENKLNTAAVLKSLWMCSISA